MVRFVCPLYLYWLLPHPPKQNSLNPHIRKLTDTFSIQYSFTGMTVSSTVLPTQGKIQLLNKFSINSQINNQSPFFYQRGQNYKIFLSVGFTLRLLSYSYRRHNFGMLPSLVEKAIIKLKLKKDNFSHIIFLCFFVYLLTYLMNL